MLNNELISDAQHPYSCKLLSQKSLILFSLFSLHRILQHCVTLSSLSTLLIPTTIVWIGWPGEVNTLLKGNLSKSWCKQLEFRNPDEA